MRKPIKKKSVSFLNKPLDKKSRYKQGTLHRDSLRKYIGLRDTIMYRSSYELEFIKSLEMNPSVKAWNIENIIIPYYRKTNDVISRHNYYMDFEVISTEGFKYLVEIKPISKTPKTQKDIKRNEENYINACKWKASIKFAKRNGYDFVIIGENNMKKLMNFNIKKKPVIEETKDYF